MGIPEGEEKETEDICETIMIQEAQRTPSRKNEKKKKKQKFKVKSRKLHPSLKA